eukprot:CAMPEP_0119329362 /NCGR_PEP_ID=MMETSP1333-20130426/75651_1 /TAXON_ID=418940 /ORGANISM="Scyphosphaera apsteinii, Strain RCC1455" /LENGTH=75 /DNA_ID=CAMNT_0007338465 /DNA_START=261 /DNA_END=488 /DNA_ORIENTATION=+
MAVSTHHEAMACTLIALALAHHLLDAETEIVQLLDKPRILIELTKHIKPADELRVGVQLREERQRALALDSNQSS